MLKSKPVFLIIISLILLNLLCWGRILTYYFTAKDTLTLIDTSRLGSIADLGRIFSEPLMSGSTFAAEAKYYRPISSLSYGIDFIIWKLNPFGYHLTDL